MNHFFSKAPQVHQVALSRFGLLDVIIARKLGNKSDYTIKSNPVPRVSKKKPAPPSTKSVTLLSDSVSIDSSFTISTPRSDSSSGAPGPSKGPSRAPFPSDGLFSGFFGKKEETSSESGSNSLDGPVQRATVKGQTDYGMIGGKGTIPLQMFDENGKTVDFTPITVWAGPEQQDSGWVVENLEAERLLLQRGTLQEDVDDWINVNRLNEYKAGGDVIDIEVKMAKLLSPPLPWFLSECMFEYITESKLPRDLKYRSLIQHPPFCQQFLTFFRKRQKVILKLWSEPKATKLYGEMMKHASSHENAKDFMRRLIQNASNSEIWENFVKFTTETLLNHAEICERIKMKTSDVATRAQLSKVIKFKTNFLKQFGSIAKKDIGPVLKTLL